MEGLWASKANGRAVRASMRAAAEVLGACLELERVQAKWLHHCAHGVGHGLSLAFGLRAAVELCHSAEFARVMQGLPSVLSPATGLPMHLPPAHMAAENCAGGAFHTAMNLLSSSELEEAVRGKVTAVRPFLCGQLYPLPAGYRGPLSGTACECGNPGPGLVEADARLELVRRGGCSAPPRAVTSHDH